MKFAGITPGLTFHLELYKGGQVRLLIKFSLIVLLSAPSIGWSSQNIDLTNQLGPLRNQAGTQYCAFYAASELLSSHFRKVLGGERVSALELANSSLLNAKYIYQDSEWKVQEAVDHETERLGLKIDSKEFNDFVRRTESQISNSLYHEYISNWLPIYSRANNLVYILDDLKKSGTFCLEKDFPFNDNQTAAYIAHFKRTVEPLNKYHNVWKDIATSQSAKKIKCGTTMRIPEFEFYSTSWWEQNISDKQKMNAIMEVLRDGKLVAVDFLLDGVAVKPYTGYHTTIIAGVKEVDGEIYLASRNQWGGLCVFAESRQTLCRDGIEWVKASSIIPKAYGITSLN
jgi:hypothetical protein